ncbi:MAG: hypothetical protein IJU90_02040 [Bacteroidales bacterium]|nr:hypothetical protein [Bacteroidales bacterium]
MKQLYINRLVNLLSLITIVTIIISCQACKKNDNTTSEKVPHVAHADWAPDVKQGINDFIDRYHNTAQAYVVFDFDNTCSIFDVCEQAIVYQLQTMSFAMTPQQFDEIIGMGLDDAPAACHDWLYDIRTAYAALYSTYGPFSAQGLTAEQQSAIQQDPMWLEFASKMGCFYSKVYDYVPEDKANDWLLLWFAGMQPGELYNMAMKSHQKFSPVATSIEYFQGPSTVSSRIGPVSFKWINGIQVTEKIKELWRVLNEAGIDVWVCSASLTENICAAIDHFGMHKYCRGVVGMAPKINGEGLYCGGFDYATGYARLTTPDGWTTGSLALGAQTGGVGKSISIANAIAPLYGNKGPLAGFMDATGDFNFCTEFASLRMVVCFNRADRTVCNGGGLIAEIAMHQRDNLHLTLNSANDAGETFYLLQGRDENGLRTFRPSNATIRYGETQERLFANDDNHAQLQYMKEHNLSTSEAINRFCIITENDDLGFKYGFLTDYAGYHSR